MAFVFIIILAALYLTSISSAPFLVQLNRKKRNSSKQHALFDSENITTAMVIARRRVTDIQVTGASSAVTPTASPTYLRQTVSVTLTNVRDIYYTGPLTVNGVLFPDVLFDTGSSTLLVPATQCCTCAQGQIHKNRYGSGHMFFYYCSESVSFGTHKIPSYLVGAATFGNVLDGISGLAGMAWPSLDIANTIPLVTALYKQNLIPANMFSLYLTNTNGVSCELYLGGADTTHYTGSISWVTLVAQSWWTVNVASVSVAGKTLYSVSNQAILDSGTSRLLGPTNAINSIIHSFGTAGISVLSQNGIFAVKCSATNFPTVSLNVSGNLNETVQLSIPGSVFVDSAVSEKIKKVLWCELNIGYSGDNSWTLGDPVMISYYSVFDYANSRIGFATLA